MKTKRIALMVGLMLTGSIFAADLEATIVPTIGGASTGEIDLTVSGGIAPFVYSWSGPGGFSSSDEDLTGLPIGTYSVTVTDKYCGIATVEFVVGELNDAAVGETPLFELSVYPNPTTGLIFIKSAVVLDVVVYNVVGEVILSVKNVTQIDLSGQAAGIYMLQVRSEKGVITQKITLTN